MTGQELLRHARKSPLDSWHRRRDARFAAFAGWDLPVQFTSIMEEHRAVRQAAGMFDISHMAQVLVEGESACEWLQYMVTNDVGSLKPGKGQYAHLCNPEGGVVDDIYVFLLEGGSYFLVLNAGREAEDLAWLNAHLTRGVAMRPRNERGGLAIQGPAACEIVKEIMPEAAGLPRNGLLSWNTDSGSVLVSRTGYTGEDGFEAFGEPGPIASLWNALIEAGGPAGLKPAGLGARDTLRLEMGYPLYGHELNESTSPYEVGYGWVVKLGKHADFIGKEALRTEKLRGSARKLVGLILEERGVPRDGWRVFQDDSDVGAVTSGTFSPSLSRGIALGLVEAAAEGPYSVGTGTRRMTARAVDLPFHKRAEKNKQ